MQKYALGIDYGTLSGRVVIVNVANGDEVASKVFEYPHAVMDETLVDGTKLGIDWAVQEPQDYLDVLSQAVPAVLQESGVAPEAIVGVGIDFTACTVMPVKADGTPISFVEGYHSNPHAYPKLWKHHAAQPQANRVNDLAEKRGEKWLPRYGGKISSEWMIPKLLQIVEEAPEVYDAMDFFIESGDWVVWQMTGVQTRNSSTAGFKETWHKQEGFPSKEYFKALHPKLENVVEDKLNCPITPIGQKAGEITPEMAKLTGLKAGTAVAVNNIDAHVTVPAAKIAGSGKVLAIMGTSTCHIFVSEKEILVPGISGVVEDGVLPGFFGYEAGQSCVGDHFAWFVNQCLPAKYKEAAEKKGMSVHQYLTEKAEKLAVGESGLIALDWWNGNRSVLTDFDLTGMMVGMTLQTKPEEMYRALIEATAYGNRKIVETFIAYGVPVDEFYASGGIAQKNPMAMQIYADVLNMPVKIAGSNQGGALGSAIFGAVAAGKAAGGYDDIFTAIEHMGKLKDVIYTPIPENVAVYEKLYQEYNILHDYFGRGANDVMKRLKGIRKTILTK